MKPTTSAFGALFIAMLLFGQSMCAQSAQNGVIHIPDVNLDSVSNGYVHQLRFQPRFDFSTSLGVSATVRNTGKEAFRLEAWLNNNRWLGTGISLAPGEAKELQIFLNRPRENGDGTFSGMKGRPKFVTDRFATVNPKEVTGIMFKIFTQEKASLRITGVQPYGAYVSPLKIVQSERFYPFIDVFGQYKHSVWPGKTVAESSLRQAVQIEEAALKPTPGPASRSRYGGWAEGPRKKGTGHFRAEKVNGKWWLIDPEGYLFWSHGLTGVGIAGDATRIEGRENYFEGLPAAGDPLAAFYSGGQANRAYDFVPANLFRKYGSSWKDKASANALKRLRSWGLNTFGNWSESRLYYSPANRIPDTVGVAPNWPKLDGKGFKFPDVFDPSFRGSIRSALERVDRRAFTDPLCIGFFIDNELTASSLTQALLRQPVGRASRQPFFDFVRSKHGSLEKLNASWKTSFRDWQQVTFLTNLPPGAAADGHRFDVKLADVYYQVCREELKRLAPEKLYFGSRLHCHYFPEDSTERDIVEVASRHCDVVCFNRYRFSAEDLVLPSEIDKPTLIGEFHFGALDRGLCYAGMRGVANQQQRADAYYQYVLGALRNPQIVGTHWWQYRDLPFTGRADGANAQIGFVDICDNPYPEIVETARRAGYALYDIRHGK